MYSINSPLYFKIVACTVYFNIKFTFRIRATIVLRKHACIKNGQLPQAKRSAIPCKDSTGTELFRTYGNEDGILSIHRIILYIHVASNIPLFGNLRKSAWTVRLPDMAVAGSTLLTVSKQSRQRNEQAQYLAICSRKTAMNFGTDYTQHTFMYSSIAIQQVDLGVQYYVMILQTIVLLALCVQCGFISQNRTLK